LAFSSSIFNGKLEILHVNYSLNLSRTLTRKDGIYFAECKDVNPDELDVE